MTTKTQEIPFNAILAQLQAVPESDRDVQFGRFLYAVGTEIAAAPMTLTTKEAFLAYADAFGDISDDAHALICEAADNAFESVRRAEAIGVGDTVEIRNSQGQVVVEASEVTAVKVAALVDDTEAKIIKTAAGGKQSFSSSHYLFLNIFRKAERNDDNFLVGQNVEIRDMVGTEVIIPASPVTDQQISQGANGVVIRIRTEKSKKIHGLGYITDEKNTFNIVR